MDIGDPFLTKQREERTSFMVKEFVPMALDSGGEIARKKETILASGRRKGIVGEVVEEMV
jgi:hypothetical protein